MFNNLEKIDFATLPSWVWIVAAVIGVMILILVFKALKTVFWPIKILLSLLSVAFTVGIFIFLLLTFGIIQPDDVDDAVNRYLPDSNLKQYTDKVKDFADQVK